MGDNLSNFAFLEAHSGRVARLGALAERYFREDPPAALIKLRQLGEFIAKDVAARQALLPATSATFDDVLRTLKARGVLPREIADLFYHLKRVGNAAAHEDSGTASDALMALKIARAAAIWFHQVYGGEPSFKAGPFVPPPPPQNATKELSEQLEAMRKQVAASSDAEAKARLQAQEAEAARERLAKQVGEDQQERQFWEQYASETERALKSAEAALAEAQTQAQTAPPQKLDLLAEVGTRLAQEVELDEATTRVLIDEQLRAAGWLVDSVNLRHASGARPEYGQAIAMPCSQTAGASP